jgi:hypothetical protein
MRRAGVDDRGVASSYPSSVPEWAWAGGLPELPPVVGEGPDWRLTGPRPHS